MGKWTREKHEEVKARHADQGERGIDAQQVWDDLGEALVEIERGWAEIERLTELVAPVEAWAQRAADVVCAVPIDDLVRAGLASEDPAVTFEELEADHDLGSLRAAHERARAVILRAIAVESVPAPSAPAEMLAAQPSPEKDNQIKRLATLSVALISARAANTRLERAMQRRVASRDELISKTTGAPAIVVEPTEAEIAAERDRLLDTYGRARTTLPGLRGDAAGWLAVAEASLARARCPTPLTEAEARAWAIRATLEAGVGQWHPVIHDVVNALLAASRGEIPPEVRAAAPRDINREILQAMLDVGAPDRTNNEGAEHYRRAEAQKRLDALIAERASLCELRPEPDHPRDHAPSDAPDSVEPADLPPDSEEPPPQLPYPTPRLSRSVRVYPPPWDGREHGPMTEPTERLCVAVLVTDPAGRVLLVHSSKGGDRAWELPGGKIDGSESPRLAAIREVREETGLAVTLDDGEPVVLPPSARHRGALLFRARAEGEPKAGSDAIKAVWTDANGIEVLYDQHLLSDLASRNVLLAWAREHGGGQ